MDRVIVQKYGGSSVADAQKIMNIARRIKKNVRQGNKIVVVVSAMGKTTDGLINLAKEISSKPPKREMDMLLSTGEQVSIAMLAMALHELRINAISMTGMQVGIKTDSAFTKAKILDIRPNKLRKNLKKHKVIIVAGFQGVDKNQNITTLGRGGSDTTAVALAAALKADKCEIYTDVDGVFTTDPRIEKNARKIEFITFDDMLELASSGAKVMHSRSIEIAKRFNVPLEVRSSFNDKPGTLICKEFKGMEDLVVTGIAYKKNESKVTIDDVPDKPGMAGRIFKALADKNINVNLIIQSSSRSGENDISFTVEDYDLADTKEVLKKILNQVHGNDIYFDNKIGIVSVVGIGMKSHPGIAEKMFNILGKNHINIQMISTSEIKISCVIDRADVDRAVKLIHKGFELDKIGAKIE